ncbi:ABC transporter permease [Spongiactinospora sp. TRM90649]|uniref:ABC transporter permease n=1 Tax=Spongiactinospora sp. TRM90649 TaxID=3031114 RepID=UPI0023F73427|nr:ABC transporter permease [Spongiactinospora sp. TRM90649]MDF5752859.1 ABC transporter permease [Spongiactinospora sp. TRM90649]
MSDVGAVAAGFRFDRSAVPPAVLSVAGLGAVLLSLGPMQGSPAQIPMLVVALVFTYLTLARLCARLWGPRFDLATTLCAAWVALIVGAAVLAPLLPLGEHENMADTLDAPTLAGPDVFSAHPLGTNNFGLDVLARIVYGARVSLVVSLAAVIIGMVVGGAIGILAGYLRGPVDTVVGVLTNSLLAMPPLILLIALATVLAPNLRNITIGLTLLALPSMIRMARANTLAFAQREFVLAARSMGADKLRIMVKELLPNVFLPLASYGMVIVSVLIVAEASLSFLGLGIKPPEPSWGNLIAEGEGGVFQEHPHIVLMPGLALFLTVFSLNLLGEKARNRWDSRKAKI